MPISARIDILKLRYFWKTSYSNNDNLTRTILNYKRRFFLESNVGYIHEIFNICCKYDCFDVWHLRRNKKENKLETIRRIVEAYHVKKDIAKSGGCLYMSILFKVNKKSCSSYIFDPFFSQFGFFPDTKLRSHFIYALLDKCERERTCQRCNGKFPDILQHLLRDCPNASSLRLESKVETEIIQFASISRRHP